MKNHESLVDALDDLRKRGYEADFTTQTVCLYCGDLDIRLNPEEFNIDEVYPFEEESSPDDNSILYAISSATGVKGTLVDSYGAYSENLSFEMAKKFQTHHAMTDQ
ncbi:MAG: phosphoribosylpyrophosphate synthetase [Chitinophagaceae bacterium]|nr:phosphoribosylpyrophosphate synthetase [Chitinophagaceae bacterium]